MFLHHRAHFLLPHFFSLFLPYFSHPLKAAKKCSESASRKSPLLISLVSVGVSVRACVCKLWTMSTAQWTQQCSKGVKCETECLARQLQGHWLPTAEGDVEQSALPLWHWQGQKQPASEHSSGKKRLSITYSFRPIFNPQFLGLSFTWLNMKTKNDW